MLRQLLMLLFLRKGERLFNAEIDTANSQFNAGCPKRGTSETCAQDCLRGGFAFPLSGLDW